MGERRRMDHGEGAGMAHESEEEGERKLWGPCAASSGALGGCPKARCRCCGQGLRYRNTGMMCKRGKSEGVRRAPSFEWGTDNGAITGGARYAEHHSVGPHGKQAHLTGPPCRRVRYRPWAPLRRTTQRTIHPTADDGATNGATGSEERANGAGDLPGMGRRVLKRVTSWIS